MNAEKQAGGKKIRGPAQPVVLIGLMGAGKTTVGKRLAKVMGRRFVDSDSEIVEAAGCSISDIFNIHGEEIFRDLEERVIRRLLESNDIVLATGGGAWMQPKVRKCIQEKAVSIWLRAEIDVLLQRVSRRNTRPLLEKGDKRAILQKLMKERYPVYEEADLTVDSSEGPHDTVVTQIVAALKRHGKARRES